MENSRIRIGKVTFIEVSTITPQNDINPVATIAAITLRKFFSIRIHHFSFIIVDKNCFIFEMSCSLKFAFNFSSYCVIYALTSEDNF